MYIWEPLEKSPFLQSAPEVFRCLPKTRMHLVTYAQQKYSIGRLSRDSRRFRHQCIVRISATTAGIEFANISGFGRLSKRTLPVMKQEFFMLIQCGTQVAKQTPHLHQSRTSKLSPWSREGSIASLLGSIHDCCTFGTHSLWPSCIKVDYQHWSNDPLIWFDSPVQNKGKLCEGTLTYPWDAVIGWFGLSSLKKLVQGQADLIVVKYFSYKYHTIWS